MRMNHVFSAIITATLVSAASALADNAALGSIMKEMASSLSQITAQASDSAQNASSAALCDQLNGDIAKAEAQTPTAVSTLPASQQATQQSAYVGLLTHLSAQVTALKADFVANDNTAAVTEIAAINSTKNTGHAQFNSQ